jgi:hypothetical protein
LRIDLKEIRDDYAEVRSLHAQRLRWPLVTGRSARGIRNVQIQYKQ